MALISLASVAFGHLLHGCWLSLQLKKVLSINAEAPINVECLMNDIDVRSTMTRELFEELASKFLDRAKGPLSQVCRCAQASEGAEHTMSTLPKQMQPLAASKCSSTLAQSRLATRSACCVAMMLTLTFVLPALGGAQQLLICLYCLVLLAMRPPAHATAWAVPLTTEHLCAGAARW